ncbi:Predicted transcriptional regulator [Canicola haemoglobinophilus]|uniref:Predicted transcriptional regulator n=2 Tax=Canicola haemoglobinophilus TaxID=733 RepID=A0A377HWF2_9PAST|nr:Predicted transcriptional regulator [Canicola haemoglobinophilus]
MEKIKKEDMHRADIVALVRKSGTSISALSVKAGLRPTLSQILCKHPFQLNGARLGEHQNQS